MKLSEFKKEIIKEFGERGWNELKGTEAYKTYASSEEDQLKAIKEDYYAIEDINNPTEEMQIEAIKSSRYMVDKICNPSKNVLLKLIKEAEDVEDLTNLFKHIEKNFPIIKNGLNEE
jgi:hypothetical protein